MRLILTLNSRIQASRMCGRDLGGGVGFNCTIMGINLVLVLMKIDKL